MKYSCYIWFSQSKTRYYTGSAFDFGKSVERHNAGVTPFAKNEKPWIVVYTEEFKTKKGSAFV
jgi:predicted GIY-YIG superfamily endonuclease